MSEHSEKEGGAYRRFCKRHRVSPVRFALILLIIALLIGGGALFGTVTGITSRPVKFSLENIGELATQSGYFTSVQDISKTRTVLGISVPFTTSKYIFSYDGVIKAGLDFEDISISEDRLGKKVSVALPEMKILSIEIDTDSLKIYDERRNMFKPAEARQHQQLTFSTEGRGAPDGHRQRHPRGGPRKRGAAAAGFSGGLIRPERMDDRIQQRGVIPWAGEIAQGANTAASGASSSGFWAC